MSSRTAELALRRQRLILRSERLREEIRDQGSALKARLTRVDQIVAFVRRFGSKSALTALVSAVAYFAGPRRPMRFLGRGLIWVSMAKRALNLYRLFVSRR
jgi:hypothetical protein